MRSFISIPLAPPPGDGDPIAVLNVHRSRPGMLRDTNPEQHFTPVVSPLLRILTRVLIELLRLEDTLSGGPTPAGAETEDLPGGAAT
ncbi:MAG: hypothetical protein V4550_19140 [Gemmatimonadota bacterium]